jgi:hypothetical protein
MSDDQEYAQIQLEETHLRKVATEKTFPHGGVVAAISTEGLKQCIECKATCEQEHHTRCSSCHKLHYKKTRGNRFTGRKERSVNMLQHEYEDVFTSMDSTMTNIRKMTQTAQPHV